MKKNFIILFMLFSLTLFVFGEEGMWQLNQLKGLNLQKKGLKIDISEIYSLDKPCIADAIVLLGGGTSELISSDGLILTNHHVAFGAVQRASIKGTDFVTNGFLAKSYKDEIEAPGYTASILQKMEDVTNQFVKFKRIKDLVKRKKETERKIKKITDKIEKGKDDIRATIARMYEGKQYILFVHKRFDDIRVVYVPPKAIGNYGGDIDNWMWPRHTGDFSFLRIYMAPDGSGRKYNKENVPYKPKYWLKIAKDNLKDGDFTFIMGYPGRTSRYRTSYSVDENLNHVYPTRIKLYKELIDLLEKYGKDSMIAKMKVSGFIKGLNNAMKNYQGKIEDMNRINYLQKKIEQEKKFMAFLNENMKLKKKYGKALEKIKALYEINKKTRDHDELFSMFGFLGGTVPRMGIQIYNTAREREKPKKLRDPRFSEKDIKRAVSRLQFRFMSFYEPSDKAFLNKTLKMASKLPESSRIKGLDYILKNKTKTIEQFVDEVYKNTKLKDVKYVKSLFNKTVKELEALDDPFINMGKSLYAEKEELRKRNEKFNANITELRKQYISALSKWKGETIYSDANRTIRFTYGNVEGYSPKDAVYYAPFTTFKGIVEKDTGKSPFDMPKALRQLYEKKDFGKWKDPILNDVPVDFLHKCDITGGNSGSPVLNANGELIGIAFDGNWEAMNSDWEFNEAKQRTISVDVRYVMFITEKLGKADRILKEVGLK